MTMFNSQSAIYQDIFDTFIFSVRVSEVCAGMELVVMTDTDIGRVAFLEKSDPLKMHCLCCVICETRTAAA